MLTKTSRLPLLSISFVALIVTCIILVFFILANSLSFNPLHTSDSARLTIAQVILQGWGFFTRDPREERLQLFKVKQNNLELQTKANITNFIGAGRDSRIQGQLIGTLISGFNRKMWSRARFRDLNGSLPQHHIYTTVNALRGTGVCGQYIIVAHKPIPWAWSSDLKEDNSFISFIHFNIICDN